MARTANRVAKFFAPSPSPLDPCDPDAHFEHADVSHPTRTEIRSLSRRLLQLAVLLEIATPDDIRGAALMRRIRDVRSALRNQLTALATLAECGELKL